MIIIVSPVESTSAIMPVAATDGATTPRLHDALSSWSYPAIALCRSTPRVAVVLAVRGPNKLPGIMQKVVTAQF